MKNRFVVIAALLVGALCLWAFVFRGKGGDKQVTYKYDAVQRGEVSESIEATGQLVALTQVDVKSKAGGMVTKLYVDVGAIVKKGDLIALIDPRDTTATYEQASADLSSADTKKAQAREMYQLQEAQSKTAVEDARSLLQTAEIRYQRTQIQSQRQPALTRAAVASAKAAYDQGLADLNKLKTATLPQTERDAKGAVSQTKAQRDADSATVKRDVQLLAKGYVSTQQVEKDKAQAAISEQAYLTAVQRETTLKPELDATLNSQLATVARLKAEYQLAQATASDDNVATTNLDEARKAVAQAKIALQQAIDNEKNNAIRLADVDTAQADIVRAKVAADNAKVQLDSTVVRAPRDGVVTTKYLEEGTIIPPGESVYSQGTSLVQISDVTQMFVDCTVDEADIGSVKPGQRVRITCEAYKDSPFWGKVIRIDPAAVTTANVTTVKARVKILPDPKRTIQLLPGMNASCEFMTRDKENVLYVPSQAIQTDDKGDYVMVKGPDPTKPIKTYVQIGISGNDNVEITDGLKEGDQVVTATIDLAKEMAIQQQMEDQTKGGLAGGGGPKRTSYATTKTKAKK